MKDRVFGKIVSGIDCRDAEYAFGECASLIENNRTELGQGFQIIAAFDQNALAGSRTNATEKGERNRDD